MPTALNVPIAYSPDLETSENDEAQTSEGLQAALREIIETTAKDGSHGLRGVHAKSHAFLEATMTIAGDLPDELAQGLFSRQAQHKTIMRFSSIAGDILDDKISLPRGLALKVIGVEGDRLPGSEGRSEQDFLFASGETFSAKSPSAFLSTLKLLAKTTDSAEWAKLSLSYVTSAAEAAVEAVGGASPTLMTLGGYKPTNPLSDTYFSQAPFRFGQYVAKFSVVPQSSTLLAIKDARIDLSGGPNKLREAAVDFFARQGGKWELRAQLLTDLKTMPIEDPAIAWPQDKSPYRTIAYIEALSQQAWSADRARIVDDEMAFSPWNGLLAHQPLGSVNRARRSTYVMSSELRHTINGCPMHHASRETALPG